MRAVIFDFDGVLVDSEPLHYRALQEALAADGVVIDADEYARQYLAYNDREAIALALERHDETPAPERVAAIAARKATRFAALSREVAFFPGARELVRSLAREVPLAIASGALRHEIEGILAAGGLRDAFGAIVAAGEASAGKPDPAPYLLALRQLQAATPGIEARQCLVIEDSPPGIASGLAAGMKVVGVASSYPPAELGAAHLVVDSLTQFRRSALGGLFEA